MVRLIPALLFAVLAGFASGAAAQAEPSAKSLRILFIGNSLTSANDLPARLASVAKATGREAVVESVTRDDFSLDDHWAGKTAEAALAKKWDYVVLQQGPSANAASRAAFEASARRFAGAIRQAGAKPAIYMVWPRASRRDEFPLVIESHRAAARAADALLLPAGEAWMRALAADGRMRLYRDALHPTKAGTDLAVLAMYFSLFPAGPQEFTEAYVEKIDAALALPDGQRNAYIDAATRAIDSPLAIQ